MWAGLERELFGCGIDRGSADTLGSNFDQRSRSAEAWDAIGIIQSIRDHTRSGNVGNSP